MLQRIASHISLSAAKDRPVQTYNQSLSFKLFIHESADRLRNGRQGLHEIFGHHRNSVMALQP